MTGFAAGPVTWWVQTWNSDGFGPWSASITFTLNYLPGAWSQTLPAADRFQLVMGGQAVLDRETGLVWDRAPNMALLQWGVANLHCAVRRLGSRLGWRLPTREEMSTLVDLQVTAPALPPGHPFSNIVLTDNYWSASALMDGSGGYLNPADQVLVVNFSYVGEVVLSDKTQSNRAWCVRGGYGYDRTN